MANKRINDLPVVTSTTAGDVVPIDGATTRGITVENLLGDNVQSIKDLTSAADKVPYFNGAGTSDIADFTSYGRSVVAVANEAAFKALVNLEIGTDVQAYDADLTAFAAKTAPSGDVVGTTDVQTLTNKTLTSPTINGMTGSLDSTVTGTTQSSSDNSTKIATTAYVDAQVAGGVAGVASLNGQTGALSLLVAPQGRLTLISGTSVMTTTTASAAIVYYTPAIGNFIPIYDGTNFVPTAFAELSNTLADSSTGKAGPAAAATSSAYDLFVWNDSGTPRLTRGPVWTNSTTRSAGTALTLVGGVYLNSVSITNGPAASRGTWVGTVHTDGLGGVTFQFGSSAAGGGLATFGLWNTHNRVLATTMVKNSTDSWTNTTAGWRSAANSTAMRCYVMRGLDIDPVDATNFGCCINGASTNTGVGIGLNSTSAFSGFPTTVGPAAGLTTQQGQFSGLAGLGLNYLQALEYNSGTTSTTWYGDGGVPLVTQSGLLVRFWY